LTLQQIESETFEIVSELGLQIGRYKLLDLRSNIACSQAFFRVLKLQAMY